MDLQELRQKIDEIDDDLIRLFQQRMDVSAEIALYKKQNNIPVYDPEREKAKLREVSYKVEEERKVAIQSLYYMLFALSRAEQEKIINPDSDLIKSFGLLGEQLAHSFSPMIHAELGDYEYNLYEKKPEDVEGFLRDGDFDGLNITIPYKKTVMQFCNGGISEAARAIGSVNTITRLSNGQLYGDNTDYYGFSYLMNKTNVNPADGKIIILGSGGSSLTVQAVLRDMGAKEIAVISRYGTDNNNYNNIEKHRDAIMIINTTPVGMYPNNGVSPLYNSADLGVFKNCQAVVDLIYNPARTELLLQAEERGIFCIGGLAMLAAQAKKSSELFTGISDFDVNNVNDVNIDAITAQIANRTQNIVLIGMPGCGKTSVGAELAKTIEREFVDTDELIIKAAGKTIPAIFAEDGEEVFRILETGVLKSICGKSGLVIATGGGVVTRPENRRIIRQNGITVFLARDISQLPVSDRPLSERDGIDVLAAERLPLYKKWSDYAVLVHGVEQTAADIYKFLNFL